MWLPHVPTSRPGAPGACRGRCPATARARACLGHPARAASALAGRRMALPGGVCSDRMCRRPLWGRRAHAGGAGQARATRHEAVRRVLDERQVEAGAEEDDRERDQLLPHARRLRQRRLDRRQAVAGHLAPRRARGPQGLGLKQALARRVRRASGLAQALAGGVARPACRWPAAAGLRGCPPRQAAAGRFSARAAARLQGTLVVSLESETFGWRSRQLWEMRPWRAGRGETTGAGQLFVQAGTDGDGALHGLCSERRGAKGGAGGAHGEAPAQKQGLRDRPPAGLHWAGAQSRARRAHPQLAVAAPPARPVAPLQPVRLGLGADRGQLQRQREQQPRPLAARAAAPRPALARCWRLAAGVRARAALPPLRSAAAALLRSSPPLPQRITHAAAWRDCPCSTAGVGGPRLQYAVHCTADLSAQAAGTRAQPVPATRMPSGG